MKNKLLIIFLTILDLYLGYQIFELYKAEVVETEVFTDYYEDDIDENGGWQVQKENFYLFSREYDFPEEIKEEVKPPQPKIPKIEEYAVQKGDTLTSIAQKNRMGLSILLVNNPGITAKNLKIGQKIKVFKGNGIFYTIKKGDTIGEIANYFGVEVVEIKEVNDLKNNTLQIGDVIYIKSPNLTKYLDNQKKIELAKKEAERKEKERLEAEKREKERKEREKKEAEQRKKENNKKNTTTNKKTPSSTIIPTPESNSSQNSSSGGFICPVRYAGINSPYGNRFHPVLKRYIYHTGVDLKASYAPLYATASGTVSYAGTMSGYGKIIIIKHSDGYESRYAHLDKIGVKVGQNVRQGELIGKTGKSGRVTGPHLHFEIRKNGTILNPMKYIKI